MTPIPAIRGVAIGAGTTRRTFIKRAGAAAAGLSRPGAAGRLRDHRARQRLAPAARRRADSGPGGLAAGAPEPAGDAADLRRQQGDRLGPAARERVRSSSTTGSSTSTTDVVNAFEKKYGVKVQISTFTTIDEAVAKIASGAGPVRRVRARARVPRAARGRQGAAAAEPQLHPQPEGRTSGRRCQPVVRRRQPLHRALHDLHHRDRLAGRQAARVQPGQAGQPVERAVAGGPEDRGQGRAARRPARGPGDGRCCTTASPTSTPTTRPPITAAQKALVAAGHRPPTSSSTPTSTSTSPTARCGCTRRGRATWPRRRPTPQGHPGLGVSPTGGRPTAADRSTTTRWRSCAAPRTRCSPTCSSTTCSTSTQVFKNFSLHLLPAADQRDDARGGGQAGADRRRTCSTTIIREAQFKNGLVQGPLSQAGRDAVGERLGGGQVGVSASAVDNRVVLARRSRCPGSAGCCCSSSCPPTRCWRSRWGGSTSCSSRSRPGTRPPGTPAT